MQLVQSSVLQNCRKVEVGRDFWKSSGPTFLLKKGHLEQVAQDHVQVAFEDLQGGRLLRGQPVPELGHIYSEVVFPDVQRQPLVIQVVLIACCPGTGHNFFSRGWQFLTNMLCIFSFFCSM